MDQIVHSLTGYFVARAYPRRAEVPRPALWGVLLANLPDIDSAVGLVGPPITYIGVHRTLTHAVLGWLVLPLLGLLLPVRWRGPTRAWLPLAYLNWGLHILMDLLTVYPTFLGWPFTWAQVWAGWQFVLAPWVWLAGGIALLLERWRPRQSVTVALGFLTFQALYYVHAGWLHARAERSLQAWVARHRTGPSDTLARLWVLPLPWRHDHWLGVVHDGKTVDRWYLPPGGTGWRPLQKLDLRRCPDVQALASNATAERFFRFARVWACQAVPASAESSPTAYLYFDVRFFYPDVPVWPNLHGMRLRRRVPFVLRVEPENPGPAWRVWYIRTAFLE
ncbi:MAG: metal-dependent hydrolase [Acidobacteria bacterium]|nr:metal-dependent hydrolase [Acidobacteriota bacterium]MDW7983242.1 metal-dependent hydrolase [Acidobacteriota bacterium]